MTLVAFRELTGWQHEMYECRSVDPQHRNEYENVYAESNSEKVGNPVEGERDSGLKPNTIPCDSEQHSGLKVNADSGGKANGSCCPPEWRLSDHFKSGQQLSLQNRPTGVAVQD